jgi:hypothetical protein
MGDLMGKAMGHPTSSRLTPHAPEGVLVTVENGKKLETDSYLFRCGDPACPCALTPPAP